MLTEATFNPFYCVWTMSVESFHCVLPLQSPLIEEERAVLVKCLLVYLKFSDITRINRDQTYNVAKNYLQLRFTGFRKLLLCFSPKIQLGC